LNYFAGTHDPSVQAVAADERAMDVTAEFDELLRKHNAPPTKKAVSLEEIDGFLKEALRIVGLARS
jgi:hypothetical protein